MGRYTATRANSSKQPRPGPGRTSTVPTKTFRMGSSRSASTNWRDQGGITRDPPQRPERTQEQKVDIANEYFALNPWYNQQKDKPVFGLSAPLPRTVRKGMWWGRGNLQKSLENVNEERNDDDGIARQDGLDYDHSKGEHTLSPSAPMPSISNSRVPPDSEADSEDLEPPDPFQAMGEAQKPITQRQHTQRSNASHSKHDSNPRGRDRAPVNEHGLGYADGSGHAQHFGMQDGLPPLKELNTHKTTDTQKEKAEKEHREHEAEQEFYNQYRNPIARLRAQYPQVPAEFLAVSIMYRAINTK